VPPPTTISDVLGHLVLCEPSALDTGCWEWPRGLIGSGYGNAWLDGKQHLVHRLVWETLVGPIPPDLEMDHLCRNRKCANPAHLEPVTRSVNQRRGVGASAVNAAKTNCPRCGSDYSHRADGRRYCRPCDKARRGARRQGQKMVQATV
jgi:hypothetical protein